MLKCHLLLVPEQHSNGKMLVGRTSGTIPPVLVWQDRILNSLTSPLLALSCKMDLRMMQDCSLCDRVPLRLKQIIFICCPSPGHLPYLFFLCFSNLFIGAFFRKYVVLLHPKPTDFCRVVKIIICIRIKQFKFIVRSLKTCRANETLFHCSFFLRSKVSSLRDSLSCTLMIPGFALLYGLYCSPLDSSIY